MFKVIGRSQKDRLTNRTARNQVDVNSRLGLRRKDVVLDPALNHHYRAGGAEGALVSWCMFINRRSSPPNRQALAMTTLKPGRGGCADRPVAAANLSAA
jgi:hypothetical protein